jgi:hypothetical protein
MLAFIARSDALMLATTYAFFNSSSRAPPPVAGHAVKMVRHEF